MLLNLKFLKSLQVKYAVYDYMQAYRDRSGFHDAPHSRARQLDPASYRTIDLGPGRGIVSGFASEKQTQLAPPSASSVEDLGRETPGLIHPGFSASGNVQARTQHLDPSTNKWTSTMPQRPGPSLDSLGKPIKTFDFPNSMGKNIDMGLGKLETPKPVQQESPGFFHTLLTQSKPVQEAMNLWNYVTGS